MYNSLFTVRLFSGCRKAPSFKCRSSVLQGVCDVARPAWNPPRMYELSSRTLDKEKQFVNCEKAAKLDGAQVEILEIRFPRLLTKGCSAHSLDLLAKYIYKLLWVKLTVARNSQNLELGI